MHLHEHLHRSLYIISSFPSRSKLIKESYLPIHPILRLQMLNQILFRHHPPLIILLDRFHLLQLEWRQFHFRHRSNPAIIVLQQDVPNGGDHAAVEKIFRRAQVGEDQLQHWRTVHPLVLFGIRKRGKLRGDFDGLFLLLFPVHGFVSRGSFEWLSNRLFFWVSVSTFLVQLLDMSNLFAVLGEPGPTTAPKKSKPKPKKKPVAKPFKTPAGYKPVNRKKKKKKPVEVSSKLSSLPDSEKYKWMYCPPVLKLIFSYLRSPEDLLNCCMVTSIWNILLQNDDCWIRAMSEVKLAPFKLEKVKAVKEDDKRRVMAKKYLIEHLQTEDRMDREIGLFDEFRSTGKGRNNIKRAMKMFVQVHGDVGLSDACYWSD
eukprot:TRINITY_DN2277_c0_g1_i1.p1 TRINITY_DN2277_c0_g1~~TRINITY_DN2277_c0_g1_i1.p1  ORF type:complete len:371 (+),score=-21.25 TRINITY_DN2277_c0_g1_i1:93-1205(+)